MDRAALRPAGDPRVMVTVTHSAMRTANELAVLKAIRDHGPVTRVRLKRETALSWGTVTAMTRDLVRRRVVEETGTARTGLGRRPVQLDLTRRRHFVAGLRLGGSAVRAVLMDLKGNVLSAYKADLNAEASRQSLLSSLFRGLETVLSEAGANARRMAGIGIAAPGVVDIHSGTCLFAPHHPQWKNVPVSAIFARRYGVPCFVDHVNNCTILGEKWFGLAQGLSDFLCVSLGTGLSVGICVNGEIYRGADSTAGEFGHIVLDPRGRPCACGKRGCLEAYVSGSALAAEGRALAGSKRAAAILALADRKPAGITAETMYRAALQGDRVARKAFETMGDALGRGIAILINLFNPQRIILCGQLTGAKDFFLPAQMRATRKLAWSFSRQEIVVSEVRDPAVLGAAAIVLQEIFAKGLLLGRREPWWTTASR